MTTIRQELVPLFDALITHARRRVISFHTPGHKNGQGIDRRLRSFTGKKVYSLDVTVFPTVDSLHDPAGPIRKAQRLFAHAYGVKNSFFLVNGSTVGNEIMLLAACNPGDSVIVSRSAHKSLLSAIILAGVWPIWVQPKVDRERKIILDASSQQVAEALQRFPEAKAVFITSPTYNGVVTDLGHIAQLCREKGKLLLVDEAHGPHLKFHPRLPISAVEVKADICVHSVHKILSGMSQGSVLHFHSEYVDFNRLRRIVSLLQTTSPNYLILASLDLARFQVVSRGEKVFSQLIQWASWARNRINQTSRFRCFTRKEIQELGYDLDETKLTIDVSRSGLSGYKVSEILNRDYRIQVDCADLYSLIAIMGFGTQRRDVQALVNALEDIAQHYQGTPPECLLDLPSFTTEMVMMPRDVFLSYRSKRVPLSKSVGHIAAQTLTPYPPGIPVLIPGERITQEIYEYIREISARDIRISGQEADTLKTIKVVSI